MWTSHSYPQQQLGYADWVAKALSIYMDDHGCVLHIIHLTWYSFCLKVPYAWIFPFNSIMGLRWSTAPGDGTAMAMLLLVLLLLPLLVVALLLRCSCRRRHRRFFLKTFLRYMDQKKRLILTVPSASELEVLFVVLTCRRSSCHGSWQQIFCQLGVPWVASQYSQETMQNMFDVLMHNSLVSQEKSRT